MGTIQHPTSGEVLVLDDVTLHASAARTATGTTTAIALIDKVQLRLDLTVSAHAGTTPTLDVAVQTSADGSTGWTTVASFSQVTTTDGTTHKVFTGIDRYVRLSYTIGGTTPSYTFSVSGEAL